MDNRLNQLNMRRPRGPVGSPYQVLPPVYPIPPFPPPPPPHHRPFPPPPPPQNVNIIVNKDDEAQNVRDYKQDVSISALFTRMNEIDEFLSGLEGLELGILTGQAYPGNEGHINRMMISQLLNTVAYKDDLNEYATISAMTENIEAVRNEIPTELSGIDGYDEVVTEDELSGKVDTVLETSETLSTVVTSIIEYMEDTKDYTEIHNEISDLYGRI